MNIYTQTSITVLSLLTLVGTVSCTSTSERSTSHECCSSNQSQSIEQETVTPTDSFVDVKAKLKDAEQLLRNGKYEEATESYVWLWHNIFKHDHSMSAVRASFMASDLHKLTQVHGDARIAFTAIRDDIEAQGLPMDPSPFALRDWLVLNHKVLDDNDRVLEWAEEMKTTPQGRDTLNKVMFIIDELLVKNNDRAIVGRSLRSGQRTLAREIETYSDTTRIAMGVIEKNAQESNKDTDALLRIINMEVTKKHFAKNITEAHLNYLAAGRHEDAWFVLEGGLEHLNESFVHNAALQIILDAQASDEKHLTYFTLADQYLIDECREQSLNESGT